jgi:signal peptidase I
MSRTVKPRSPGPSGAANETAELVKTVLSVLVFVLLLRVLLFQPFTIPSASMEPNLYEGDYIVVTKFSYGWSRHSIPLSPPLFSGRILGKVPHRGDIVVFKTPRDNRTDLIKRVIGLPGDTIQMKQGLLYLNGEQVPRVAAGSVKEDVGDGYIRDVARYRETLPGGKTYLTDDFGTDGPLDNTDIFVVPEGHYFVMGDNRDNSADSRVPPEAGGVGYMPAENLVGHAQIVLISWNKGASLLKPWTWLNLNTSRFLRPLH